MIYFRIRNDEEKNEYYLKHFSLKRPLVPTEVLSISDVKEILPIERKNMANYIAQIIGDSFKTSTSNIGKKDDGMKYIKDYDKIIGKITL